MTTTILFVMDLIGTIAFAISGAMVAIEKEMDIFGVNFLAVTTAVGGGMIRDVLIGTTPPRIFQNPAYILLSILAANIIFAIMYWGRGRNFITSPLYEKALFFSDALGLAVFSVDGVSTGFGAGMGKYVLLVAFLGMLTGVGGGILRDVMANQRPYVFVKHIYALASLVGAILTSILWGQVGQTYAMFIGFCAVLAIRIMAAKKGWNLPKVQQTK